MAVQGTIAEPQIKVTLTGLDKAFAQLKAAGEAANKLKDQLGVIGAASGAIFGLATGKIQGFLKAFDPLGMQIFEAKLQVLSFYIGKTFEPLLNQVIGTLDRLISYFKNLTDAQREQILHWTKIILAVTGVGAVLGTLIPIISQVITIVRALMAIAGMVNPWIAAITIVIGLFTLLEARSMGFKNFLQKLQGVFVSVWDQLQKAVEPVIEAVIKLWDTLQPIFEKWMGLIGRLVQAIMPLIQMYLKLQAAIIEAATPFLEMFGELAIAHMEVVLAVIEKIVEAIQYAMDSLEGAYEFFRDNDVANLILGERKDGESPGAGDFSKDRGSGGDWGANSDRFKNHGVQQKPQFIAIADVFKQVQQSAVADPMKELQAAQLAEAKTTAKNTARIADNTANKSPASYAGSGDF